ncbi:helix-turn-helix domain protein [Clostridium puniceum]|uniref:Helix-turn-helix domain protein n=1 Tax=Clostridium puniceum TaxID=29367 RepID=A0A1S8TMK6_9CLOT|nr:helix-turn-helix transcriptional regulator [Clostridium puniceum]OOM78998.1 helix-turn-helix domain protein [Clostridium puniceum]
MINILEKLHEKFLENESHERIKFLRRQNNLTIREAAEKSITTEKCWSDWEHGKVVPRDKNKKIIASVLGVDVETIFGTSQEVEEFIR